MTADRELLELAAKAAGFRIVSWTRQGGEEVAVLSNFSYWQPLLKNGITDCDGDALRLAAALKIDIEWQVTQLGDSPTVEAYQSDVDGPSFCASEHQENYRRAIVRAAAAIGESMP